MRPLIQQQLFFLQLTGTPDADGHVILHSVGLKPGGVLTFDIVSTMAVEKNNAEAVISFHQGDQAMYLRTVLLVKKNFWYKTRGPIRLPSDWCVQVDFSDLDADSHCKACFYGYVEYPE